MDIELMDRLIEILNKETAVYEGIFKLFRNKTDAIVEGKVSELEGITRLEQSMVIQLSKLEEEREELVDKLAVQLNVKASDITLDSLGKLFPKEQAQELENCHNTLPRLIHNLGEANTLNSKLIRNSLDFIDFSINVLTNAGSAGNNYRYTGQSGDSKKRNFFDMKL